MLFNVHRIMNYFLSDLVSQLCFSYQVAMMFFVSLKHCVIFGLINFVWVIESKDCRIPNEVDYGNCVIEDNCDAYTILISQRNITNERAAFLTSLRCSQLTEENYICCPKNGAYK